MSFYNMGQAVKNGEHITLNFVGDSITLGTEHCRAEETYVAKFAVELSKHFYGHKVFRYDGICENGLLPMKYFDGPILVSDGASGRIDVIRNGIGGNTLTRAHNRIDDFTGILANGRKSDVTFMMFGINDALKPDPTRYTTPEQFEENYKKLIHDVKKRDPETAIVLMTATYNDWSVDGHCEATIRVARQYGLDLIDTHKLWTDHYSDDADNFGHGDWLAGGVDACHPTPLASEIMAKYVFGCFKKLAGI
ncbi:MAG: hypothetical protein E7588_03390 [Ruminococcaceae bacterium]|nr:hypothetical protein [Oscillospiraceae bacterium]